MENNASGSDTFRIKRTGNRITAGGQLAPLVLYRPPRLWGARYQI